MSETKTDIKTAVSKFPTRAELEAASDQAKRHESLIGDEPIGTILGLPDGYVGTLIPSEFPESRREALRVKWRNRGYKPADGPCTVVGYDRPCEVWVALRSDWLARRQQFARRRSA